MDTHPKPTRAAYSIDEACEATTLSRSFIKRLIAEKRLDARKIGSRVLIPAEALERLVRGDA